MRESLDPAAATEHLTPEGKRKPRRRKRGVVVRESETVAVSELKPVVRPPESLRKKKPSFWWQRDD